MRSVADDPAVTQLVALSFGGPDEAVHGRDAILAALAHRLARGERVELVPRVEVVAADGTEVAAMRAAVSLHDPGARHQLALAPSLSSVQDAHLLGLRLDRPQQRSARAVYAAFLGMDERELRGTEDGGAWRWYPSDRTVRWAPVEGAPWARRWKATRAACTTPSELWERLVARSILPQDVVDGSARVFFGRSQRNVAVDEGDVPRSFTAALLLASDADGLRCAEALAKEAVTALAPWNDLRPRRVGWVDEGGIRAHPRRRWHRAGSAVATALPAALWELIEQTEAATAERRPFVTALERAANASAARPDIAIDLVEAHLAWRRWCADDRAVPATPADWPVVSSRWSRNHASATGHLSSRWEAPEAVVGRRFRALLDPTRPLVGLLALGYTPFHVSKDHLSLYHPTPR